MGAIVLANEGPSNGKGRRSHRKKHCPRLPPSNAAANGNKGGRPTEAAQLPSPPLAGWRHDAGDTFTCVVGLSSANVGIP